MSMGINTNGLFSQMQSNSAYSGRGYELRRQLEVRREQLEKLEGQDTLNETQLKKRDQLQSAVNHLQGSLSKIESPVTKGKDITSLDSQNTLPEEGQAVIKSPRSVAGYSVAGYSASGYTSTGYSASGYTSPGYSASGYSVAGYTQAQYKDTESVTYKNPGHYDGNATTPQDTYLKGFFLDIRL